MMSKLISLKGSRSADFLDLVDSFLFAFVGEDGDSSGVDPGAFGVAANDAVADLAVFDSFDLARLFDFEEDSLERFLLLQEFSNCTHIILHDISRALYPDGSADRCLLCASFPVALLSRRRLPSLLLDFLLRLLSRRRNLVPSTTLGVASAVAAAAAEEESTIWPVDCG